jgi:nucleotide sugar dehydrogenase
MRKDSFKIGIIGQGFVGSAIREGLINFYEIFTYDVDKSKSNSTHREVCNDSDIIFICLPTPMKRSGECDIRILKSAIKKIDDECKLNKNNPILVIKSTIPPLTTTSLSKDISLDLCFSPEFLTEANSFEDFKNQTRIIIGGPRPATGKVKQMFRRAFPTIPIIKTGTKTAEMVKYFTNCFLATKVTFANEIYDICSEAGIDFDKVTEYALYDSRIGKSHLMVPGPDGDRGFGGHCFPKDIEAIIFFAETLGADSSLLKNVIDKNYKIRKNRDWEKMKGRAVSDD